jgi:hypothetical protein
LRWRLLFTMAAGSGRHPGNLSESTHPSVGIT